MHGYIIHWGRFTGYMVHNPLLKSKSKTVKVGVVAWVSGIKSSTPHPEIPQTSALPPMICLVGFSLCPCPYVLQIIGTHRSSAESSPDSPSPKGAAAIWRLFTVPTVYQNSLS